MGDAPITLDVELFKWSSDAKAAKWKEELLQQGIGNLRALEERTESSRWQSTLDKLSDGLVAKLENWHKSNFLTVGHVQHNVG